MYLCTIHYKNYFIPLYHSHNSPLFIQEHFDFYANDENIGPIVMSVKDESTEDVQQQRVMLRTKRCTEQRLVTMEEVDNVPNPVKVAKVRGR